MHADACRDSAGTQTKLLQLSCQNTSRQFRAVENARHVVLTSSLCSSYSHPEHFPAPLPEHRLTPQKRGPLLVEIKSSGNGSERLRQLSVCLGPTSRSGSTAACYGTYQPIQSPGGGVLRTFNVELGRAEVRLYTQVL